MNPSLRVLFEKQKKKNQTVFYPISVAFETERRSCIIIDVVLKPLRKPDMAILGKAIANVFFRDDVKNAADYVGCQTHTKKKSTLFADGDIFSPE